MESGLTRALIIAAIALGIVIGTAFFIPDLIAAQSGAHPFLSTIQQGGAPHDYKVIALGWVFGVVVISIIFLMLSLGASRGNSLRGLGWPLAVIYTLIVASWTGIVYAYLGYIGDPDQATIFGLPLPTGMMIFVMTPIGLLVNVLFVVRFPKSILTAADLDKYRHLADASEDPDTRLQSDSETEHRD